MPRLLVLVAALAVLATYAGASKSKALRAASSSQLEALLGIHEEAAEEINNNYSGQLVVRAVRESASCCCRKQRRLGGQMSCRWWPSKPAEQKRIKDMGLGDTKADTGCKEVTNVLSSNYARKFQGCCDALEIPRSKYNPATHPVSNAGSAWNKKSVGFWWHVAHAEQADKRLIEFSRPDAKEVPIAMFNAENKCAKPFVAQQDIDNTFTKEEQHSDAITDKGAVVMQKRWEEEHQAAAKRFCVKSPGATKCLTATSPIVEMWDDLTLKDMVGNLALQPLSRLYIDAHGHYYQPEGSNDVTAVTKEPRNALGDTGGKYTGEEVAVLLAPHLKATTANTMRISIVACGSGQVWCPAFSKRLNELLYVAWRCRQGREEERRGLSPNLSLHV